MQHGAAGFVAALLGPGVALSCRLPTDGGGTPCPAHLACRSRWETPVLRATSTKPKFKTLL